MEMSRYISCMGAAALGEADMARLKRESARGWHLAGMSPLCLFYRLERGEPRACDYCAVLGPRPDGEALELYREGGWEPVAVEASFHVLRAQEGATPVFTDEGTRLEALSEQRRRYGGLSLGCLAAAVACLLAFWLLRPLAETPLFLALGVLLALAFALLWAGFAGFGVCYLGIRRAILRA